jgi:predicted amidophosphoribosyltransferase
MAGRSYVEVSAPYANFMLNPAKPGDRVCRVCRSFAGEGYTDCMKCGFQPDHIDVVVPISYSVGRGQMHHALRYYKDGGTRGLRQRFSVELAAVLWRFLVSHERCVARAAGVEEFEIVATVPSGSIARDDRRENLRRIVGEICGAVGDRYERLLTPTDRGTDERRFDPDRYRTTRQLSGENVLLIDDTWTTGRSAQSAAFTLKQAGAGAVALVVLGRHVNLEWEDNERLLKRLTGPFDWEDCAVHAT